MNDITEKQLAAIPGISSKGAWNLVSRRAKLMSKGNRIENVEQWFNQCNLQIPEFINEIITR
jgi:hypothetical protein